MYRFLFVPVAATLLFGAGQAVEIPPVPETPKRPVEEAYHGVKVSEDYRWLEKTDDPAVRKWVEAQNRFSRAMLDRNKALPMLHSRLKELMSAESATFGGLRFAGGVLFAMKRQPPKEQPFLVTLRSVDDPDSVKVVLDPNQLDRNGKTSIDFFVPSRSGKFVAVSLSEGGSEEGTVYVYETASGKKLPDVIARVNCPTAGGDLVWDERDTGFYYTRYPRDGEKPKEDVRFFQRVAHHRLGNDPADDRPILGEDFPRIAENFLDASADGKYLLVSTQQGDGGEFMHHLRGPDGKWTALTRFSDGISAAAFGAAGDDSLYLLSRKDAPRGKILRLSLDRPDLSKATVIVPHSEVAIDALHTASNRLVTVFKPTRSGIYVVDSEGGPSRLRFVGFDSPGFTAPLPAVASVKSIVPVSGDEVLIQMETFLQPIGWFRYAKGDKELKPTALMSTSPADFSDCEVVREFATSKDGTRVPMSILRKKGLKLDGSNPTLLYGYGGYGSSVTPRFRPAIRIWLEQGGVYALANLRGGAEYGEEWHKGGNLTRKQNVFDDFAACARRLIELKYTAPKRLAVEGGSNGGLLMGAMITQHPDLFQAVVAHVGIYDMLRFELHPNGAFNVTEFGSVKNEEQFKALFAYSPYHRVKVGTKYPAVFLLTGINDGRVDPANSLKMTACLQAASSSKQPVLLQVSFDSGHGIGDRLSSAIDKQADVYAFLFAELGMEYQPTLRKR